MEPIKVLFVCLGNICRSPMAEGLLIDLVGKQNLATKIHIDSAGTSGHHDGELADARMRQTATRHGIQLTTRSRQIKANDLHTFDYILAMDRSNLRNIEALRHPGNPGKAKLHLMREFDPLADSLDVPDPYYGGQDGFEAVFQMLGRANAAFLEHLRKENGL